MTASDHEQMREAYFARAARAASARAEMRELVPATGFDGYSEPAIWILHELRARGPATPAELTAHTGFVHSTVHAQLKLLRAGGLIDDHVPSRPSDDQRERPVKIIRRGRSLLHALADEKILAGISELPPAEGANGDATSTASHRGALAEPGANRGRSTNGTTTSHRNLHTNGARAGQTANGRDARDADDLSYEELCASLGVPTDPGLRAATRPR